MYDVVILGGGPGGYAAALYAHNFDLSVAIVEKDKVGGTCLHRGCIPAKAWLHTAEVMHTVKEAASFGVRTGEVELVWPDALANKRRVVDQLHKGLSGLLKQRKVDIIHGTGRLDGPGKVVVDTDEGQQVIEGRNVILATGSYPRSIPGYDFNGTTVVSSDHALDWDERPGRVAIIGAGAIGCEFASFLVDLGSEVTLFEMLDQVVPGSDPAASRELARQLKKRGVTIHTGVGVGAPQETEGGIAVPFGEDKVEVDVVLVAVGRSAMTEGIGLETTSVATDRGFVEADLGTMLTGQPGVYAVGDIVAGTPQLAHAGFAEGIAAITHLASGEDAGPNYRAIPLVVYTNPELAEVGLTEAKAIELGYEVETHRHAFGGVGRAIIRGRNAGLVKLVVAKDGPILGATIVGPEAGEMIHELMYAVGWEALPDEAASFIHAHPTLSEAVGETLLAAAGRGLH